MPQYQGVWTLQQQMQALTSGQWATDPNFKNTTLLLQGDAGANGAQNNVFYDTSPNQFAITRNGNTTQGSFTPFSNQPGAWGNYFDGASYLQNTSISSNLQIGTSNFTVEFWVYPTTAQASQVYGTVMSLGTNASGASYYELLNNGNGINFRFESQTVSYTSTTLLAPNQWYHIAVVRSSTSTNGLKFYINGINTDTFTVSDNFSNYSTLVIGSSISNIGVRYLNGYVSNLRVVIGTAVYTSNFTPSTIPLTAISGTQLLTCQSNRFVDNSSNAYNVAATVSGTPSVQAFSPFAPQYQWTSDVIGGSGYFDGTGDYLTVANNAAFNFTGDFTIEAWVYFTSTVTSEQDIVSKWAASGNYSWLLYVSSGVLKFARSANGTTNSLITGTTSIPLNSWNHVAVSGNANSGTIYLYLNGVSQGSGTTVTFYNGTSAVDIGSDNNGGTRLYSTGYISNVRLIKGTSLYPGGTTFTPPTTPLTAVTNTQLLLNFTNAGIYDGTMKNNLETVGGASVSTSVVKYGSGSMYFDGTGDRLTTRFTPVQDLSGGNWTIEFWMNLGTSVPTTFRSIAGASNGGGSVPKWSLILNCNTSYTYQANRLQFATYNGGDRQLNIGFTWAANTWYHIAIACNNGTTTLYIDGVSQGSMAYNIGSGITGAITVGADSEGYSEFTGYLDDFRVTKGIARYTQNFIPPSVALPRQ